MIRSIFKVFNFDEEKEIASKMSTELTISVSPKLMSEGKTVMSAKKISRTLEKIYSMLNDYQSKRKIGAIRRAVLANNFKWELKARGYPEKFIDVAVEGLIVEMGKKTP